MTACISAVSDLATTDDQFLGGALAVRQPKTGYRAGLDAVLLAAFCPARAGRSEWCLDCGAGAGVAGLALARRISDAQVTLIERDALLASLAADNCAINGLAERVSVINEDLTRPLSQIAGLAASAGKFDHVIANPPYYAHGTGTRAPDPQKDASHAMPAKTFEAWARFAAAMLTNGGSFTIVQRSDALPEILLSLARRFGRVRILPLYAREGQAASRVLVQAIKGSRAGLQILPGRILHSVGSHAFTPELDAVLRGGAALLL